MSSEWIYQESLSSNRTEVLFLGLTSLFGLVFIWRMKAAGFDLLAGILFFFGLFFLFYSLNYRTLAIRLSPERLMLRFGIFTWSVPIENIRDFQLDELPAAMRLGGAGIHFMFINQRYQASFNFLEYPRVLIDFKRKVGPVQAISFSTCRPDDLIHSIQAAISSRQPQPGDQLS